MVESSIVSILNDIGLKLPVMMRAIKLQKRAATVGFDWLKIGPVVDKIEEEIKELREEIESGAESEMKLEIYYLLV